jgi:hypothetical protein
MTTATARSEDVMTDCQFKNILKMALDLAESTNDIEKVKRFMQAGTGIMTNEQMQLTNEQMQLIMGLLYEELGGKKMEFNSPQVQEKIEQILGKSENIVLHSPVPFQFGYDLGGRADVYLYKNHIDGIVYVTGDLIGQKQRCSDAGNFEFMVAHKADNKWGPNLISNLSYYTLDSSINSGETMDIGTYALPENTVKAIIFDKYATFRIGFKKYGLMLVIGITEDELEWKKRNGGINLIDKLKEKNIYPITDLKRRSIFQ